MESIVQPTRELANGMRMPVLGLASGRWLGAAALRRSVDFELADTDMEVLNALGRANSSSKARG